jgi:hypothetical protein
VPSGALKATCSELVVALARIAGIAAEPTSCWVEAAFCCKNAQHSSEGVVLTRQAKVLPARDKRSKSCRSVGRHFAFRELNRPID